MNVKAMVDQPFEPRITGPPQDEIGPGRPPGGPSLAAVVGAFVVGLMVAMILGAGVYYVTGSLAIGALVLELGFLVGVVGTLALAGHQVFGAVRLRNLPGAAFPPSLVLGFALLLANIGSSILLGPAMQDVEFMASAESLMDRISLAIAVALFAPVVEEILFRGLLQGTLEKRLRPWLAIGVASMAFALMHGPQGALFFFFWSLPIGWVTWRTDSIRPAIIVHAVNNTVGLVGLFARNVSRSPVPEAGAGTAAFGVLLVAIAAFWSVALCRRIVRASEAWERAP